MKMGQYQMTDRLKLLNNWLANDLGFKDFELTPASEDASFRRYFRIKRNGQTSIVMDAPPDKEDCRPFIDVTERLLACDVNAPKLISQDL